jgi:transposase
MAVNWKGRQIKKRLMPRHLDVALKDHEQIVELYKEKYSEDRKTRDGKRDWRTYEQRIALRMKNASMELKPVVEEAYSMIDVQKSNRGQPEKASVTAKVLMLLIKDIFGISNRKMANMLSFFSVFTGIDISYKTVERAYSDELARMTIHNAFVILVRRKGIKHADVSGDGTGYSLTVTKHYRNEREKELKKLAQKEHDKKNHNEVDNTDSKLKKKARAFVYAFALMDLDSHMYIGYGVGMNSEHEAYHKALGMANGMGIEIGSVRLDKLYSYQSITEDFGRETKIFVIPKKNATIRGPSSWKRIIRSFVTEPFGYLSEYYKRNNSESGFSVDKRVCGWKVWQKLPERIETAIMCKGLWHNLMLLY